MGVAHRGANVLMAEELLNFPQILSHVVKENCGRRMPQSVGVTSPTPRARQAARSRKLNARLDNGSPEYPANTTCDPAKAIPPGNRIRRALKSS